MLRNQGAAGKQVVIVGAALALVAQFLCLASATRRLRPGHVDVSTAVLFNVEFALIVENLVFMLGVQSVGEPLRCQWVALALHYLHLVTGGWFLANTAFLAYRLRCNAAPTTFRPVAAAVWLLPAVLVSAMYAAQPRSYETHRYCWMAVQRGMLLTFVAPVTLMITVNSALTLRGLRARPVAEDVDKDLAVDTEAAAGGHDGEAVRERDAATPAELRTSLRAAAAMLPLYSADWFLGVVAMDNSTFLTYPLLFLVTNGFLNWFLMVCAWLVVPRESHKEGGDWCGGADGEDLDDEDELLLEDDDAGCWGKGSGYGSAYGTAFNAHGEEQALIWAANAALERSNAMSGEPRVHVRPPPRSSSCSRWDESFLRDGDAALPAASSPAAAALSQELAEMRYDGGISTISS
ncbi:cadherin EGF LAG seven-pass G-type receptor 3-like isoform X2 [Thrips palmi]|uniref:Cadherin EGF LAG seven-pass G-type receptor 3-like isoform X2 n=1 Tax=Thrips palmi TaxID=161013 RepID=A0A6P8ZAF7_THRPL|nr:cadherin EGF LAG seven-pass G-type receptor 3-like isoform X2 [Thrips palmi]